MLYEFHAPAYIFLKPGPLPIMISIQRNKTDDVFRDAKQYLDFISKIY